jgi:hypothetical protein
MATLFADFSKISRFADFFLSFFSLHRYFSTSYFVSSSRLLTIPAVAAI